MPEQYFLWFFNCASNLKVLLQPVHWKGWSQFFLSLCLVRVLFVLNLPPQSSHWWHFAFASFGDLARLILASPCWIFILFENIEVVGRCDLSKSLSTTEVRSELNDREKQKVHVVTETHFYKKKIFEGLLTQIISLIPIKNKYLIFTLTSLGLIA